MERKRYQSASTAAGLTDRYFLNLPTATDANKIAAMTLLNFTFIYSFVFEPEIGAMALFRLVRLATNYGTTAMSPCAFSGYGLLLTSLFGRVREGFRFVQLALAMLDQLESRAWLPRVYTLVHGVINIWVCPFRESFSVSHMPQTHVTNYLQRIQAEFPTSYNLTDLKQRGYLDVLDATDLSIVTLTVSEGKHVGKYRSSHCFVASHTDWCHSFRQRTHIGRRP
jgi:hypothetical protein